MKILGIGIDLENISRFRKLPCKKNRHFYEKIFTAGEIKYCLVKTDPYPSFAARFAAKEAVIKALPFDKLRAGSKQVSRKDIEISLKSGNIDVRIRGLKNLKIFVSMTHTKEVAAAIAIITRR